MHRVRVIRASLHCALFVTSFIAATAHAQIAGENVNMVSGTEWPGGDKFLQRQNEPSIAVSSANSQHLLAGANDYRSVDLAFPDVGAKKTTGDSWLGLFKSLDGGQTWRSVLLPGYPQACDDPAANPDGLDPSAFPYARPHPLCGHPAAADPVVRAGTDGMLYYAGITFKRDKSASRVFVARFIDLDNKEGGDATKLTEEATRGSDPMKYIETKVIATAPAGWFIDKPWMAVDVARDAAAPACRIPALGGAPARSFPAGTVYVAWTQFKIDVASGDETASDVMLSSSRDCGASWSVPIKLNTATSKLNQGVSIAIDPIPGRVYVAWRRYGKTPLGVPTNQSDAILATRSNGRSKSFTTPRVIGSVAPFDQGSTGWSFRTDSWPTMAISTDGKSSWAHVAWQQKLNGSSRIVMSTASVHPPPPGEQDPDDPDYVERDTRLAWSAPVIVDGAAAAEVPVPDYTPRGHQFMPSLTFGQGRLVLTYYDSRFDHTQRLYKPRPPPWETTPLFDEQVALVGDLLTQSANAAPSYTRDNLPYVFNEWITDVNLAQVRHTVEVRVAATVPGPSPRFATSQRVSRFDYGARRDGNDLRYGSGEGELWLQQLQFNPPNLPIFAGGTRAFLGDYIDVQGPAFIPRKGGSGWEFNSAPTSAPVFHAVWTSNQDVRVPFVPTFDSEGKETGYEVDWTQYTPVGLGAGRTSTFDPAQTCAACVAATAGSRDQNIYTSRITEGLRVAAPQNAKPLSAAMTRAFVVTAENDTSAAMTVTFTASTAASGVGFSFVNERFGVSAVTSLTATIPPRSGVARSLFVKLTDASASPSATLAVTVDETGCTSPCRSAYVTLNPPVALASLVTPDGSSTDPNAGEAYDPNMGSGVVTAPAILGPAILGPAILGPAILGPAILGESIASPAILGPAILGPAILGPAILGPAILGDSIASPAILGPAILGPAILGPAILGDGIASPAILGDGLVSTSLADVTYTVKNQGNTTASYHLQFVASQEERESLPPVQLIVTRTYETPVASGCELKTQARNQLVATTAIDPRTSSAFVSPSEAVDPKVEQGSPDNLSFAVAPGAELAITARVNLLADLGRPPGPDPLTLLATKVRPFVVASSVTPGSSGTYESPSSPGGIGAGASLTSPPYLTRTGLTSSPGLLSVRVARTRADGSLVYPAMPSCAGCHDRHAPSLPSLLLPEILAQIAVDGPVFPVGTVELLRVAPNGSVLTSLGVKALDNHGGATLTTSVVLAAGETVVAVFRGSALFAPSRSSPLLATAMSLTTDVEPWSPQVTFMASLTTFGSSPTGTVTFRDGAAALAAVPLACTADLLVSPVRYDCQASFRTTLPLAPGPRSVTATYPGDGNHESSTSNAVAWTMPAYQVLQQTAMELGSFPILGDTSPGVNQRFGQVVPGAAGRIAGIRVPVYCSPGATLKLEFKVVTDYKPDDRVDVAPPKLIENANGLLPVMYPSLDQFTMIRFDTPVVVAPTDPQAIWGSFAIVLSATGYCTLAQGPAGDPYPGFGAFFFNSSIGEWRAMAEERDLPFQIFMQLVQ